MPGVYVNDYNQGVVAGGIGMRGFNTEGDIMHVKLLVGGIPTNVNVFTSPPGRYSTLKLLGGAFGTGDAQGTTAFSTGRLSHVLFASIRTSRGYRDNSDLDRHTLSGNWVYAPSNEAWSVGLVARTCEFETQAPGYLTRQEAEDTPRASPAFSDSDGGEQRTRHVSPHLDRQFSTVAVSLKGYRQTLLSQRFVRFTEASAQQERLEDESQTGGLATITWRSVRLASRAGLVSAGADIQTQGNIARRFRTVRRAREAVLRDWDFDFTWTEAQGNYFLTTANADGRFGRRALTNVDVVVAVHRRLSLGLHVKNAFDRYHEYVWLDGLTTLHSPGERRAAYVTTTVEF